MSDEHDMMRAAVEAAHERLDAVPVDARAEEMERQLYILTYAPVILPATWRQVHDQRFDARFVAWYMHARAPLKVMVTAKRERDERRWLHVSVSHERRLPDWNDLREVKDIFIGRERRALQILPPESEYVNIHPRVLHLWACLDGDRLPDFRVAGSI